MIINLNFNRRAMLSICFSLFSLVALTFIYALWEWRQDWLLAHHSVPPKATVATVDESAKMIAEIPSSHLFGRSFSNGRPGRGGSSRLPGRDSEQTHQTLHIRRRDCLRPIPRVRDDLEGCSRAWKEGNRLRDRPRAERRD